MIVTEEQIQEARRAISEAWDFTHDGDMIGVRRALSHARAALEAVDPEPCPISMWGNVEWSDSDLRKRMADTISFVQQDLPLRITPYQAADAVMNMVMEAAQEGS